MLRTNAVEKNETPYVGHTFSASLEVFSIIKQKTSSYFNPGENPQIPIG
jgi:hypothetical protein